MEHRTGSLLFDIANNLAKAIYKLTLDMPYKYQSSIGDQMRRSSLSVVLNIVEGGARKGLKEKRHASNIAFGSLKETKYLLYFAHDLGLLDSKEYSSTMLEVNKLAAILYGLLYKKRSTF